MSKKIEIIGNALIVTNTEGGVVEIDRPSKDTYYDTVSLDGGNIVLLAKGGGLNGYAEIYSTPLATSVDSGGLVAFTAATFRAFVRAGLG